MVKKTAKQTIPTNFWKTLPKPFFVLAPMANVTDAVFRQLFAKYGKPDVTWTEFVSADGLVSPGKKKLLSDLNYIEEERPIVAQLFTGHPDVMEKAAKLVAKLGFDGLDINTGCPDKSVEKQGGGAAMIKSIKSATEVINAARKGAPLIPVSVKTRLGYNKIDWDWIKSLLELKLPALTVHLRTRKEMSLVPAQWELMPEIVRLRNEISPETLILGNGDVQTLADARIKTEKYGCDGVMIGRGIFGKPWFFATDEKSALMGTSPEQRLAVLLEHTKLFDQTYLKNGKKGSKGFDVMKKHFKAYVNGWDNAKDLRVKLMETTNYKEVEVVVNEYLESCEK